MVIKIKNFGKNLRIRPSAVHQPHSAQEVLAILTASKGQRIRAIGRRHSWSEIIQSEDALIDLRHINDVRIESCDGQQQVTIGAGCQIKRAIATLDKAGLALPSQGLITEQTVAGAIATGTHGSGKHSLSHYVMAVTLAVYDPETGEPLIREITQGEELEAVRCALGCMGIIISVTFPCQAQYMIEEHMHFYENEKQILDAEQDFPIQQFYILPHSWLYLAQHRRVVDAPKSTFAPLFHAYWYCVFDVGLHLIMITLTRIFKHKSYIHWFYKRFVRIATVLDRNVVDKSHRMLTMENELFTHIEIEIFVKRSHLSEMIAMVRTLLMHCDGDHSAKDTDAWQQMKNLGMSEALANVEGKYTHHYPICIRKVLPDETLISMASSDDEAYYAVSLIAYNPPGQRQAFYQFAQLITQASAELLDGRPHWGKICPLSAELTEKLYPKLSQFRSICDRIDTDGAFRNPWANELIFNHSTDDAGKTAQSSATK